MKYHHRKSSILAAVILVIFLAGCNLPLITNSQQPTPVSVSNLLLTPQGGNQLTPTPFQPDLGYTDNVKSTPTPIPPDPNDRVNILVLGSDWRPSQGYRTDVILLVSIRPRTGTISMVSFPRDLFVTLPGYGQNRINEAMEYGGFALLQSTFMENFGVRVDNYIITNFNGFVGMVNTLGGVEVNSGAELYDRCQLPQASDGYCYVPIGTVNMDGQTALWYVRSRHSTSDIDRQRRAQEVMIGIVKRLISLDAIVRAPQLWSDFSSSIETDLSLDRIVSLLPLVPTILTDESRIHRYAIGWSEVTGYIIPSTGADVLLPNYSAINAILNDAFSQ